MLHDTNVSKNTELFTEFCVKKCSLFALLSAQSEGA